MAQFTLTEAQRILLIIIANVESGGFSPEDAVRELKKLKSTADAAGLLFKAEYTLSDFQAIRKAQVSTYDFSEPYIESSSSY